MPFKILNRVEMSCDICGLAPDHFVSVEPGEVARQARNFGWEVIEAVVKHRPDGYEETEFQAFCPTCWEMTRWFQDPLGLPQDLMDRDQRRNEW